MSCEHVERDLDAYLDRELDPSAAAVVRAHISECAACRRQVAERDALSQLVRAAPYYTAPERLRTQIMARTARPKRLPRVVTWAAAAVLLLSVSAGVGVGVVRWSASDVDRIAAAAVDSHVRSLMAAHLYDVESTDQHTVKPWFLGKLDFAPPVTDLAGIGFPLVGGRLDYLYGQPAAALVYQRRKHTINVFVLPAVNERSSGASSLTVRGFHTHHWVRDGMSFWAVSDVNDTELTTFVQALATA
jgi:anti-sigma factor RsiW